MNYMNLTFNDDSLDRKKFILNMMNIIEMWNKTFETSDSLVIALNSGWGSGKSFLMNMWKNWLVTNSDMSNSAKYAIAYFNAWENDDFENPFIPIAYSLREIETCGDVDLKTKNIIENSKVFIKSCGIAILKDGIKKFVGEETAKIISEGLEELKDIDVESFFDNYKEYLDQKNKFSAALDTLIPYEGKLIVMIDELDRCRPNYSIETLEIIKHFFNKKDVVFILAVDIEQLSHSISTLYGNNMDSNGYLRRFFDVTINIPQGDIYKFIKTKYEDKLESIHVSAGGIERISNQYLKFHLTLRDIEKITHNLILFCMFYNTHLLDLSNHEDVIEFYTYFIILKHKHPDTFKHILRTGFMSYDNRPENYPYLDIKYYTSTYINDALKIFQGGRLQERRSELNEKYGIVLINERNNSLAENVEKALEMLI